MLKLLANNNILDFLPMFQGVTVKFSILKQKEQ